MDTERLAEIRADAAELCGTMFPSSEVLELCDHIDALQAENERLRREAINARRARVASLREQNQGLQARVTLLEGLLGETRDTLRTIRDRTMCSCCWCVMTMGSDYGMPSVAQLAAVQERVIDAAIGGLIDAALSRSDTSKDAL